MVAARLKFLIIVALFVIPLIMARLFYQYGHQWLGTTNHGQLLAEPISLAGEHSEFAQGKWSLMYLLPSQCGSPCEHNLYQIQQIRLALGKDMLRVQRIAVSLAPQRAQDLNGWLAKHFPGTEAVYFTPSQWDHARLPQSKLADGQLYIVDPRGFVVMTYPNNSIEPKPVYDDLQQLLKVNP